QAYGSITGTVFAANGTTPASNVTVYLAGPVARNVANPPSGAFTFNTIPVGTYRLDVYDQFGNRRAFVQSWVLSTPQGTVQRCNLTMSGVGTVTGIVKNPDGSPAPNVYVSLQGPRSVLQLTDTRGAYTVAGIPTGNFSVSASIRNGSQQLFGSKTGQIAT